MDWFKYPSPPMLQIKKYEKTDWWHTTKSVSMSPLKEDKKSSSNLVDYNTETQANINNWQNAQNG